MLPLLGEEQAPRSECAATAQKKNKPLREKAVPEPTLAPKALPPRGGSGPCEDHIRAHLCTTR